MRNKGKIIFFICIGLALTSCSKKLHPSGKQQEETPKGYVKAMIKQFKGREGCDIALQLESGELLEPNAIPETFQKDSLLVWVRYKPRPNVNSICMMGKMITIKDIKKR